MNSNSLRNCTDVACNVSQADSKHFNNRILKEGPFAEVHEAQNTDKTIEFTFYKSPCNFVIREQLP